ncbi:hypothetical protein Q7C36_018272 [Tachysurus vachellii]|uniref:Uncharacterized protein n=1 Tax=Tachysurus vachellii TaxID=175792 RepID=A0AA88LZE1_TACVA|nr:hypothetical protein Q7C36_018272 [Tachysurus vachellii]
MNLNSVRSFFFGWRKIGTSSMHILVRFTDLLLKCLFLNVSLGEKKGRGRLENKKEHHIRRTNNTGVKETACIV